MANQLDDIEKKSIPDADLKFNLIKKILDILDNECTELEAEDLIKKVREIFTYNQDDTALPRFYIEKGSRAFINILISILSYENFDVFNISGNGLAAIRYNDRQNLGKDFVRDVIKVIEDPKVIYKIKEINFKNISLTSDDFEKIIDILKINSNSVKEISFRGSGLCSMLELYYDELALGLVDGFVVEQLLSDCINPEKTLDEIINTYIDKKWLNKTEENEDGFFMIEDIHYVDIKPIDIFIGVESVFKEVRSLSSTLKKIKETSIESLDLSQIPGINMYLKVFSEGLRDSNVKVLDLSDNNIDYENLKILINELSKGNSFNLERLYITEQTSASILDKENLKNLNQLIPKGKKLKITITGVMNYNSDVDLLGSLEYDDNNDNGPSKENKNKFIRKKN